MYLLIITREDEMKFSFDDKGIGISQTGVQIDEHKIDRPPRLIRNEWYNFAQCVVDLLNMEQHITTHVMDEEFCIPMLLWCPMCGSRHIDAGEFATKPHHTHACQHCGITWRPALVNTVGVQFLPGFKDDDRT